MRLMLRMQRLVLGLRQYEVAKRVGITPGYLSMIECGKRRPGREVRKRIAQVLRMPGKKLFD